VNVIGVSNRRELGSSVIDGAKARLMGGPSAPVASPVGAHGGNSVPLLIAWESDTPLPVVGRAVDLIRHDRLLRSGVWLPPTPRRMATGRPNGPAASDVLRSRAKADQSRADTERWSKRTSKAGRPYRDARPRRRIGQAPPGAYGRPGSTSSNSAGFRTRPGSRQALVSHCAGSIVKIRSTPPAATTRRPSRPNRARAVRPFSSKRSGIPTDRNVRAP
jgi:hypothetical protein